MILHGPPVASPVIVGAGKEQRGLQSQATPPHVFPPGEASALPKCHISQILGPRGVSGEKQVPQAPHREVLPIGAVPLSGSETNHGIKGTATKYSYETNK